MPANNNQFGRRGHGPGGNMMAEKIKPKNAKGALLRLLSYMRPMMKKIVIVFVFAVVAMTVGIVCTGLNGYAIDNFIVTPNLWGLAKICLLMAAIYLISAICTYFQNGIMIDVSQKTTAEIRKDLFDSMQHLPLKYFDSHSSGDIMSRLTNDVDNINNTLSQSVAQLLGGVINVVGMLIAMLLLNPFLTLIGILTVPIMLVVTRFIAGHTKKYFKRQQKELGELNGYAEEMVSGQKAIILFRREEYVKKDFKNVNQRLKKSAILSQAFSGIMGPTMNLLNNITYLLIAAVGGYMVIGGIGGMTIGVVFSFLLYMKNFSRPLNEMANLFNTLQSALAGAERVFEIMDEPKEQDTPDSKELQNPDGDIVAEDVSFSYLPGKPVLKHASFNAEKGQTIAIVGPTGAGKTTIISLLTRFYDMDSGTITIDGTPITDFTRDSLRKNIGMVLQDTYLFAESVMENIRYGRLTATDQEVIDAAKQAGAHSFITQLEDGYDTILSDNAQDLSQGQRQLLAIARAILAKPSILILDEATSSIDTRTELKIQEAMQKLMQGRTNFVIAHRLSTIRNADMILVIDNGEIIERGTHDQLLQQDGFYATLYNSQFRTGMAI